MGHPLIYVPKKRLIAPPKELWTPGANVRGLGHGHGHGHGLSGATAVWTPASLGATREADWDATIVTLALGKVAAWPDQSGNGHHMAQVTAGNQPVPDAAAGFNGKPSVRFDAAAANYMSLSSVISVAAAHAFLIWEVDADPAVAVASSSLWTFGSAAQQSYVPLTDGNVYDGFGTDTRKATGNPATSLADPNCYEVISTASEWTSRVNGVQHYTTAVNTVGWLAAQHLGVSLYLTSWMAGRVARLIICNAKLTGADLANMYVYLNAQYGVVFP